MNQPIPARHYNPSFLRCALKAASWASAAITLLVCTALRDLRIVDGGGRGSGESAVGEGGITGVSSKSAELQRL